MIAHCDFCPATFEITDPKKFNQRTCPICMEKGTPSQTNPNYETVLAAWLRKHGRRLARSVRAQSPPSTKSSGRTRRGSAR